MRFAKLAGALALAAAGCSSSAPRPPTPPDPAKAIARSLAIIRDAAPGHPQVLKILFYGQSISVPKWTDQAMATLRARYPDVAFDYRNLALGGWSADTLQRAAARDVDEAYPDLIVFHVYGDEHAYEHIVRDFRARTAADVIIQTDHVVTPVEPVCAAGLHLRWSPPPGCIGHIRFKQHERPDFMSGLWLPTMAHKYRLALDPRRQRWDAYLKANRLPPMALIADEPHPNARGWALMARLFTSWFEGLESRSAGVTPFNRGQVRSLPPPRAGTATRYAFDGNRIELLAAGPLAGHVTWTVDGKPPQAVDGCWQTGRASRLPNVPDWPVLRQVSVAPGFHRAARWTVRLNGFDAAQRTFAFTVRDDGGRAIGTGSSNAAFTSSDGVIGIDPKDWVVDFARKVSGVPLAEGASFSWDRRFVCADQPAVPLPGGGVEQRLVLATGLANGPHVVVVTLAPGAPAVREARAYRPPLKL